ncbi:MAG: hypothetical protein JSS11_05860 [Verrucomicrobia bacterium]|nr:hypothetical protein [Verrucomicrobiota bacterium]
MRLWLLLGAANFLLVAESRATTGNTATPSTTAIAAADNSSAYGTGTQALSPKSIAIGHQAQAGTSTENFSSEYSEIAIGASAQAIGQRSIGIGAAAQAFGHGSLAMGVYASAGQNAASMRSVAVGPSTYAHGKYALAVGYNNTASGQSSMAVGRRNQGTYLDAVAVGYYNLAQELQATAIGFQNTASGNKSTAFGHHNIAQGKYSMAFGARSIAEDENSMVLGMLSTAGGLGSLSAGYQSETDGEGATAVGFENHSLDKSASAFGRENVADGLASSALGYKNTTGADYATAIGSNVTNNTANSVMIGPSDTAKVTILSSGNVGIGMVSPTQKLEVNGTIRAKEVLIETTGWSDYVFDQSYRLAPLSEVEQHIKTEGHLPGIPSAQQVAEHGVSIGEMQSKLLAKIEELTLHQIAQEKELARISSENAELRNQVQQLKTGTASHPSVSLR